MFRNPLSFRPNEARVGPISTCIYCGFSDEGLTREHVIPDAIWGALVLERASCLACAEKIKAFEPDAILGSFTDARSAFKIHSRKRRGRKGRPRETTYWTFNDEGLRTGAIEHPATPWMPMMVVTESFGANGPLILTGNEPPYDGSATLNFSGKNFDRWQPGRSRYTPNMRIGPYSRLMAKIAHGYAVAAVGASAFEPWLLEYILMGQPNGLNPYYVGIGEIAAELPPRHELQHRFVDGSFSRFPGLGFVHMRLLVVSVRLFAHLGVPESIIVVGRMR